MSFKKIDTNLTFADIALSNSRDRNMAIKRMKEINAAVDWKPIEEILIRSYPVGKSFEGNEAYPPLISAQMSPSPTMVPHQFRS